MGGHHQDVVIVSLQNTFRQEPIVDRWVLFFDLLIETGQLLETDVRQSQFSLGALLSRMQPRTYLTAFC